MKEYCFTKEELFKHSNTLSALRASLSADGQIPDGTFDNDLCLLSYGEYSLKLVNHILDTDLFYPETYASDLIEASHWGLIDKVIKSLFSKGLIPVEGVHNTLLEMAKDESGKVDTNELISILVSEII